MTRSLRPLAPESEEQVWEGVSHLLMMDDQEKFNSAVSAFVTKKTLLK